MIGNTCGDQGMPTPWKTAGYTLMFSLIDSIKRQSGYLMRPYKQLRKEVKGKGERERYQPTECQDPENNKDREEGLFKEKIENIETIGNNRKTINGKKIEISLRKLEISRDHFIQGWA